MKEKRVGHQWTVAWRRNAFLSALSAGIVFLVFFVALNLTPMAAMWRGSLPISRVDHPSSLQKFASKPTHHKASLVPSCSASWGRFEHGGPLLTETQLINRNSSRPKFNASRIDNKTPDYFFFDPDTNFAFCVIEKNACSQWQTVLRNVMDKQTEKGASGPVYYIANLSQERHGYQKLRKILESPNSTVAVVVRDPLARFASGYLDKCFEQDCRNSFCFSRFYQKPRGQDELVPQGQPISFVQARVGLDHGTGRGQD